MKKKKYSNFSFKRFLTRGVSGLVVFECVALAWAYTVYRKLNHDHDFRYKCLYSTPEWTAWIVEGYYKVGETLNPESKTRQLDQELWRQQGRPDV